jgi:hypothetical protein
VATGQLIPRAKRAGNFSRGVRARTLNLAFASISVVSYSAQLGGPVPDRIRRLPGILPGNRGSVILLGISNT